MPKILRAPLVATLGLLLSLSASAQTPAARVAPNADMGPSTRLAGHLPAWVKSEADTGAVADGTTIHFSVMISRPATLQAAFEQLLADQQNPSSPRFQKWLTPLQIGQQYGPADADVKAVLDWLTSQGLQVELVSASKTFVNVTGRTSDVGVALGTSFHNFTFEGTQRYSATSEPSIPLALSNVVTGFLGLTDLPIRSYNNLKPAATRISNDAVKPFYSGSGNTLHYIFPGDFPILYDANTIINSGFNGAGVKVAIIGRSEITNSDITTLQSIGGFAQKTPVVKLVPTSTDPGLVAGDEDESTLDVDRVLGTAPGAEADLVIAANASGGITAAIQYNINTLVDPIMTISYGLCEAAAGQANTLAFDSLFQTAAGEGISTFVSSGDSAAAACSTSFSTPKGTEAVAMGNYLCASSYVTCVGGTEFADTASPSSYWAATNSTYYVSALGYIPEGAWNEPTTSSGAYQIAGSGGGVSAYITKPTWQKGTGVPADGYRDIPDVSFTAASHDGYYACLDYALTAPHTCATGYGVIFSGTSAAAPDMAATAAILVQKLGKSVGNLNPTIYGLAASTPSAFHDATPATSGVGTCAIGTASMCNNSVAGPSSLNGLAGYPLTVGYDQVTGWGSLDITNFVNAAYSANALLASTTTVTATPTTALVGQTAIFTATVAVSGTTAVSGTVQFYSNGTALGSPVTLSGGTASTPATSFNAAGTYSITAIYSGSTTYATSTSPAISFVVTVPSTSTRVTANPTTIVVGKTAVFTAAVTITGSTAATGTVQFYSNGAALGSPVAVAGGSASTPATTFATAGTFSTTAIYSGDANNAGSTSPAISFVVTPLPSTTTVVTANPTTIVAGKTAVFTAAVSITSGTAATGTVQFYSNGSALGSPVTVSGGSASTPATTFATAGTFAITASYAGDTSNAPSTSTAFSFVVSPLPSSTTTVSANPTTILINRSAVFTASISVTSGTAPTGTVQFYQNGAVLGSPVAVSGTTASTPATVFSAAGNYLITATYSGDTNNAASTSTAFTFVVSPLPATTTTLSLAPTSVTTGGSAVFTATVSGTGTPAATGTVQFQVNSVNFGAAVTLVGGRASTPSSQFTTVGTFSVVAIYSGDASNAGSSSAASSFAVTQQAPTGFAVSASPTTLTVAAGATTGNTSNISLSTTASYYGSVGLSCGIVYSSGTAVDAPACALSSTSVAFGGVTSGSSVLTVSTTVPHAKPEPVQIASIAPFGAMGLAALVLTLVPARRRRKLGRGGVLWMLPAVLLLGAGLMALSGCGGSGAAATPVGTSKGTYTVTVTATPAGGSASTATVTLTVQ